MHIDPLRCTVVLDHPFQFLAIYGAILHSVLRFASVPHPRLGTIHPARISFINTSSTRLQSAKPGVASTAPTCRKMALHTSILPYIGLRSGSFQLHPRALPA